MIALASAGATCVRTKSLRYLVPVGLYDCHLSSAASHSWILLERRKRGNGQ